MSLITEYELRRDGCLRKSNFYERLATSLHLVIFLASSAAAIAATLGYAKGTVFALIASVPAIAAVALTTFKPDARAQWWQKKYAKLDDLVGDMKYKNKDVSDAHVELTNFLAGHELVYPRLGSFGTIPSEVPEEKK